MSTLYEIPLSNTPQSFQMSLAGKNYLITSKWNDAFEAGWTLDFADADTNTSIVSNVPLITGIDILSGLEYLNFGGALYIYTDGNQFEVPTMENLGVQSKLYFVTSP
jgi:hypothetical protein